MSARLLATGESGPDLPRVARVATRFRHQAQAELRVFYNP